MLVGLTGGAMAFGLSGCGSTHWQRNVYASFADCSADDCMRLGRADGERYFGPVYRVRNGRPSSCNSEDRGAGYAMFYGQRKPDTIRVAKGQPGTACRGSSSSSGWRSSRWGSASTPVRRESSAQGLGGVSSTASHSSGVTRGVFGSRGGSFSGG